ncbi:MAG: hypothetical protein PHW04_01875 [Candidatus Wallbacteria bacterium]|nr:hypothetical protein [Candidatus Wallbacteria bacterium]
MKCPHCQKDDNCWTMHKDEVVHLPCKFTAKQDEMLDRVRENNG